MMKGVKTECKEEVRRWGGGNNDFNHEQRVSWVHVESDGLSQDEGRE